MDSESQTTFFLSNSINKFGPAESHNVSTNSFQSEKVGAP